MSIGNRLRQARLDAGLSQFSLAEQSGISQQMISKIERGESSSTTVLVPLAIACGVRPEWLHAGQGKETEEHATAKECIEIRELVAAFLGASALQRQALLTIAKSINPTQSR